MLRAILIMFVSMSLIPTGDTAGKLLVVNHGVTPIFLAWSRFFLGALLILPFIPRGQFDARLLLDWRIIMRALLIVGCIASILTALKTEPLPLVFGAFFVSPILSYFMSAWLLNERITTPQTALLLLGFCGVMLVVKPGFGMSAGLGFAMLAGLFYGGFLTTSRWLTNAAPPRALLLTQLLIGSVVLAPFALTHIPEFTPKMGGMILFSATASVTGNLLLVVAYRLAPASRLAPFVYFQLIAATVLGWTVFGHWPDTLSLTGLVLLMTTGIASWAIRR